MRLRRAHRPEHRARSLDPRHRAKVAGGAGFAGGEPRRVAVGALWTRDRGKGARGGVGALGRGDAGSGPRGGVGAGWAGLCVWVGVGGGDAAVQARNGPRKHKRLTIGRTLQILEAIWLAYDPAEQGLRRHGGVGSVAARPRKPTARASLLHPAPARVVAQVGRIASQWAGLVGGGASGVDKVACGRWDAAVHRSGGVGSRAAAGAVDRALAGRVGARGADGAGLHAALGCVVVSLVTGGRQGRGGGAVSAGGAWRLRRAPLLPLSPRPHPHPHTHRAGVARPVRDGRGVVSIVVAKHVGAIVGAQRGVPGALAADKAGGAPTGERWGGGGAHGAQSSGRFIASFVR